MKFLYKGKTYDVLKVNGNWRVYSTDMKITTKEAKEIIEQFRNEEELVALEMIEEEEDFFI